MTHSVPKAVKKTIKVAIVNWNGSGGGAERSLRDLAMYVDRENFELRFYFLVTAGAMADQISAMGHRTEFLRWTHWATLKGRRDLVAAVRQFDPDIIHVHVASPMTRCVLKWFVPGAHLVASEHGPLMETLARLAAAYPTHLLYRMDYRFPERIIVYSKAMAQAVLDVFPGRRRSILVCPLGIDLDQFDPERCGSPAASENRQGSAYRIGYVGRILNRHKGTDHIPRIARKLLERGVSDFEIVVVGDGPDKDAVEALSRDLGVSGKIAFAGWQDDIPAWMGSFDVLVVPSRFEPFGLVVCEAVAMQTRVVAFDVGGLRDAAAGSADVHFVPPDDCDAMAETIIGLKGRHGRTRTDVSRERIVEMYSARNMARALEAIYRDVLQRDSGDAPS